MAGVRLTTMCLLVTLAVLQTARASGDRQAAYKRVTGMDGLQLTTAALFQVSARSNIHCSVQCSRVDGCLTYTFIAEQPSSCRGYDVAMTSPNVHATVPAAGAKTFGDIRPVAVTVPTVAVTVPTVAVTVPTVAVTVPTVPVTVPTVAVTVPTVAVTVPPIALTTGITSTEIRLVNGASYWEGRVELFLYGQWGTVCDDRWTFSDAVVVCRQLGLNTGNAVARTDAYFGEGSGNVLMTDVGCSGSETRLTDCSFDSFVVCFHYEDAGVSCAP